MKDTPPEVEATYRRMLLARPGEERLRMACSMYATARALAVASILETEPQASPGRLRQALFLRFHGHDFDADTRAKILARLAAEVPPCRRVAVDWDALEIALTWHGDELVSFLDLRTGEVRQYWPSTFTGDAQDFALSEDEADEGLAEGHLVRIEPIESSVEYSWMAEFAASVTDARLRDLLDVALDGRGAFRRFKDVLAAHPRERERWFRFHDERVREAIREWLEENDIEPTTEPPERAVG